MGMVLVTKPVQDGQDEGGGFSCAGLGAADDVLAGKSGWYRLRLYFGRGGIACGENTLNERVGKTKISKRHRFSQKIII